MGWGQGGSQTDEHLWVAARLQSRQPGLLTSVVDGLPLVELALVGQGVVVSALDVSEGGHLLGTRRAAADFVSAALPQTIPPSVLWTAGSPKKEGKQKVSVCL